MVISTKERFSTTNAMVKEYSTVPTRKNAQITSIMEGGEKAFAKAGANATTIMKTFMSVTGKLVNATVKASSLPGKATNTRASGRVT